MNQQQIDTAIKHYQNHLKAIKKYQQTHPEKMNQKSRDYYKKIKEDPDRYAKFQETKRQYYQKKKQESASASSDSSESN